MDEGLLAIAQREIAAHPAVLASEVVRTDKTVSIAFEIDLDFPSRWAAEGVSPTGLAPVEMVRLDFTEHYPFEAPTPSFRNTIGRKFPHVQPYLTHDERPVPCLTEMDANEYLALYGLYMFVDQFVTWLKRAAGGELIDPAQGWEPMRRDSLPLSLLHDETAVRALPFATSGGYKVEGCVYNLMTDKDGSYSRGYLAIRPRENIGDTHRSPDADGEWSSGTSYTFVVWARDEAGAVAIQAEYEPDNVHDFAGLKALAKRLNVYGQLTSCLQLIANSKDKAGAEALPVVIVFVVRRPYNLIGRETDLEIIPFLTRMSFNKTHPVDQAERVYGLCPRAQISKSLMKRLSGTPDGEPNWIALGAGSLGSKIALHLSRAGLPPAGIMDSATIRPHNAARHALYPNPNLNELGWSGYKVYLLARAVQDLGGKQVCAWPFSIVGSKELLDSVPGVWGRTVLMNTTASPVAREWLSTYAADGLRISDCELFGRGKLAVMRTESWSRNPNSSELASIFYADALDDQDIAHVLFSKNTEAISVGQGCGSDTMVATDADISLHAAALASQTSRLLLQDDAAEPPAEIRTWLQADGGLRAAYRVIDAGQRIPLSDGWVASVSADVDRQIRSEAARWSGVETGGVLIGRASLPTRSIHVVKLLPAPRDSVRRADFFELGIDGLSEAINDIEQRSDRALYCVGTWHTHLGLSSPSQKDRSTSRRLIAGSADPQVVLILGRDGYSGLFDPHNK